MLENRFKQFFHLLDKIIDFGYGNNHINDWYQRITEKIFTRILESIYDFSDLETLPSQLKSQGLGIILSRLVNNHQKSAKYFETTHPEK